MARTSAQWKILSLPEIVFLVVYCVEIVLNLIILKLQLYFMNYVFSWPEERELWPAMAIFDGHAFCAHCREKRKGQEPFIANKDTADCSLCNSFTPEQRAQISTPSYKIKKEKTEAKRADNTQPTDELVDPSRVSVIRVVSGPSADKSPAPPEKKTKKDKPPTKSKKSSSAPSSATEDKFSALEDKWVDRFNRLEALLLARSIEPTFSSDVRVAPDHPPPGNVTRDSEPFFQPSDKPLDALAQTLVLPCSRHPVS